MEAWTAKLFLVNAGAPRDHDDRDSQGRARRCGRAQTRTTDGRWRLSRECWRLGRAAHVDGFVISEPIELKVGNHVQKQNHEKPDDVDEVPVQRNHAVGTMGRKQGRPVVRQHGKVAEHQKAHNHVRGMEGRDGVEDGAVGVRLRASASSSGLCIRRLEPQEIQDPSRWSPPPHRERADSGPA